jgi:hypothetical protein
MHFPAFIPEWSRDPAIPIIHAPSPWDTIIGQRNGLSAGDLEGVKALYTDWTPGSAPEAPPTAILPTPSVFAKVWSSSCAAPIIKLGIAGSVFVTVNSRYGSRSGASPLQAVRRRRLTVMAASLFSCGAPTTPSITVGRSPATGTGRGGNLLEAPPRANPQPP